MAITATYSPSAVSGPNPGAPSSNTAATPAQLAAQRANQVLGQKVEAQPVALTQSAKPTPGSDVLRDQMVAKGMENVSKPPSDENLRTWYSQHAPHADLIAKGDYKGAAAAYEKDAGTDNDQDRMKFQATQRQLECAARMQEAAGKQNPPAKVSFPPTLDEAKAHFRGLKDAPSADVSKSFTDYTRNFYVHAGEDSESIAKKATDVEYTPHPLKGLSGPSTSPTSAADVTSNLQVNKNGQRVIDCEGYTFLGQELLKEAGYSQPAKGGFHRISNSKNEQATGHVMLEMRRDKDGEKAFINNYTMNTGAGAERASFNRLNSRLGCAPGDMQDYTGNSLDEAIQAQIQKRADRKHKPEI